MRKQYRELLLRTLETGIGGVVIYSTALKCVLDQELRKEWTECLDQTGRHIEILYELFESLGLDREEKTAGRLVVRHLGESLVEAIELARLTDEKEAAELFACECIVLAETRDHSHWQLLVEIARNDEGTEVEAIRRACAQVEEEEAHLYHSKAWCRELWIAALGMPAALPPQEEIRITASIGLSESAQKRELTLGR